MIAFVLVVWFGFGNGQTSFAVPGIASQPECARLAKEMGRIYQRGARADCYPYRMVK
ncbi:hypothetical protein J2Y58_002918 [Sphingomonas sp. BE138]|uniref:hypothetical protein n=1 Tax=Sphingomonas sp. BE138 TaxID=2817845 RepID=UPI0028674AEC|nr:hypothetical protein [Sphingomonas sp. BE138]MDR6789545.1 hypothetical protein [Sphingomonas sp. BE138]